MITSGFDTFDPVGFIDGTGDLLILSNDVEGRRTPMKNAVRWIMTSALLVVFLAAPLAAKGTHSSSGRSRSSSGIRSSRSPRVRSSSSVRSSAGSRSPRISSGRTNSSKCSSCSRNSTGRISRNPAAKRSFERTNPCPSTGRTSGGCPGYLVDHVTPLKRGGADTPSNMQWQTKEAAKEKDRVE